MGSRNPGRFRREGREAFVSGANPEEYCPYNKDTFWDEENKPHWLEGWKEAEEQANLRALEQEEQANLVDQNQCKHIYSLDPEIGLYSTTSIINISFSCDFCPNCGKDLRKENSNE